MPRMVDRWRMDGSFQPVLVQDARMYGFVFLAHPGGLADEWLRGPSGGAVDYEPLLPLVLVTFSQLGRVSSADGPYHQVGWATETEATIWVFFHRGFHPVMFAPYIFVDLPFAISQGREIYGFPKELGWFDHPAPHDWHAIPADGPAADEFTVDVFGSEEFDEQTPFARQRLLTVRRTGGPRLVGERWDSFAEASGALHGGLGDHPSLGEALGRLVGRVVGHPLRGFWPPIGTVGLLKQFWDATDGAAACLQSIVEADIELRDFAGGWRLGGTYEMDVRPLASHPLHRDLGWDPAVTTFPCLFAYWLDFSFELGRGRTLWRAP